MLRNALPVPLFFYWSIEFGNGMETVRYGDGAVNTVEENSSIFSLISEYAGCLQCFDTVGWAAGRASDP